jgi:hypothetical protein
MVGAALTYKVNAVELGISPRPPGPRGAPGMPGRSGHLWGAAGDHGDSAAYKLLYLREKRKHWRSQRRPAAGQGDG